jgi:tRNA(Ile)-lysidine synthase
MKLSEHHGIFETVDRYFERFGKPKRGARILAAISGGPDSVALLTVLGDLAPKHRWAIGVAHVNHGLRGRESDGDESFVRTLAQNRGLRFHCRHLKENQPGKGVNLQLWARSERYRFLESTADRFGYAFIAVAHNLDDRAETVAAAILDASGTVALSGIPPVRGRIIRPLFDTSREAITRFLESKHIPFRVDSSNTSCKYQRNRIRHDFLPSWERENPAIIAGLARMGEQVWLQRRYLERQAQRIVDKAILSGNRRRLTLDVRRLSRYDVALDPFVLRDLIDRLCLDIVPRPSIVTQFSKMRRLTKTIGRTSAEQGGLVFQRSQDRMLVMTKSIRSGADAVKRAGAVPRLKLRVVDKPHSLRTNDGIVARFDLDLVSGNVGVRWPTPGDRYQPIGLNGTKKLFDLLAERKVPAFERPFIPVVVDGAGILWPVGHPIAHRARMTGRTKRVLEARLQEGSWKSRS